MLAKITDMLKKNPVLFILYLIYMALSISLVFLLLPEKLNETDLVELLLVFVKLVVFALTVSAASLLFFSGYGNMLSAAAAGKRVTIGSFAAGLKKYTLKLLLAGLLLAAIIIVYSIALGILLVPVILIFSMGSAGSASEVSTSVSSSVASVTSIITVLPTVLLMPLIILWFPAIFSDNIKVTESLRRGVKTGVKCYGKLLLWTAIVYLPTFIYTLASFKQLQSSTMYTPSYFIVMGISVVLSFLYMCAIFILYRERYQPESYCCPR